MTNHDSQHGSLSNFRVKTPFGRRGFDEESFHILRVLAVVFVIIDGGYRL